MVPTVCEAGQMLSWLQVPDLWWKGVKLSEDCQVCAFGSWTCVRALWWARIAKLLTFTAGTGVVLDLIGVAWIAPFTFWLGQETKRLLEGLREGRRNILIETGKEIKTDADNAFGCGLVLFFFFVTLVGAGFYIERVVDWSLLSPIFAPPIIILFWLFIKFVINVIEYGFLLGLNMSMIVFLVGPLWLLSKLTADRLKWTLFVTFCFGSIIDLLLS